MPLYAYKATTAKGIQQTGYRYARDQNDLYASLKMEGSLLTDCEESSLETVLPGISKNRTRGFIPKTPRNLLIDFCHNMAQLDQAGVPLSTALQDLALSATHRRFRVILYHLHADLQMGIPLSEALGAYPKAFDEVFQALIRTAEQTGDFAAQFRHLETLLRQREAVAHQLQKSLRSPLILLCLLVALVSVMVEMVIPNMASLLSSLGLKELPFSTKLLIWTANILAYVPFLVIGGGLLLAVASAVPALRFHAARLALCLPFYKSMALSHFWHVFGVMVSAGVELMPSLSQAAQTVSNPYLRKQLVLLSDKIREGAGLSEAFKENGQKAFSISPLMMRFLKLSEQTGNLRTLLPQAAEQHRTLTWRQMETAFSWIEPCLILIMGGFMLWVVLAIIVPFYSILGERS